MSGPMIHLLDDRLIGQIAAGEVVERPASVVKELVENSLDSGASDITVELEGGGKRRITITDDGSGMAGDDALLAFDRHATSKISSFEDLESVATLGFRGEALATIAAVARVEMRTAASPGDGQRVRIEGGRVRSVEPVSHPRGTRLEIASLFFNVPARRKFLKRPQTELRRSVEVEQGYALAHPQVRFTLRHEGRTLLETQPAAEGPEGLRERIGQVFGRELSDQLHEIPLDFIIESEAITGFVGGRETVRSRRTFVYVNGRLIRDRILMARFYKAVRDEWRSEDFPALFLFLELEPQAVDVNVHPQKAEVRFRDPGFPDRVEEALRRTLDLGRGSAAAPLGVPRSLPQMPARWEGLGGRPTRVPEGAESPIPRPTPAMFRGTGPAATSDSEVHEPSASYEGASEGAPEGVASHEGIAGQPLTPIARPTFTVPQPSNSPLSGRGEVMAPFRLLGQYKGSLLLLEGHDGLYLIDQHAAHERILYERLRRSMETRLPASQGWLHPVILELSTAERMRLEEMTPMLEDCGFGLTLMSGNSVALTAAPDVLSQERAEALIQGLATSSGTPDSEAASLRRRLLEGLAADMSCKAAIKIHRPMVQEEMEALISELFDAEQPYACPHGRPTVLFLGDGELERRFGRR